MKKFLGDENKPMQFSKTMVFAVISLGFIGMIAATILTLFFALSEVIAGAIIACCSTIIITSLVWMLKKSQAENTIKLYLYSYKEILKLKKENGEDTSMMLQNMEDNVAMQLDSVINSGLSESTSPIERQDVY